MPNGGRHLHLCDGTVNIYVKYPLEDALMSDIPYNFQPRMSKSIYSYEEYSEDDGYVIRSKRAEVKRKQPDRNMAKNKKGNPYRSNQ